MTRSPLLMRSGAALLAASVLALSGCQQARQSVKDAAAGAGEAAKTAATGAAQSALGPAVTPVLTLLRQGKKDLKAGDLGAAVTAMGGFQSAWDKAAPVLQPLAGDKWASIDAAAKTVSTTFAKGAKPEAKAALEAINGLIAPLKALAKT